MADSCLSCLWRRRTRGKPALCECHKLALPITRIKIDKTGWVFAMQVQVVSSIKTLLDLPLKPDVHRFVQGWWARIESGPWRSVALILVGGTASPGVLLGRLDDEVLFCDYFDIGKVASPDLATYDLMGTLKSQGVQHRVKRVVLDEAQCTNFGVQQALEVMGFARAPQALVRNHDSDAACIEWVA